MVSSKYNKIIKGDEEMLGYGIFKKSDIEIEKELNRKGQEVIHKLNQEIFNLQNSIGLLEFMKSIKDEEIVGIRENRIGDTFLILKRENENSVVFSLRNQYNIRQFPDVYLKLTKNIVEDKEGEWHTVNYNVDIVDIHAIDKGHGNGKILIEEVIRYAKRHNYKTITGIVTWDDKRSTPWLTEFYRKNGFKLNKEETSFTMWLR